MQKSKSSTNVGQFVSKKLLKSRSRSQTRSAVHLPTTYNHKWAPSEKFAWTSENGDRICILDSVLRNLSAIESKYLQQVALQKINELNIGLDIGPGSYNGNGGKIQKRHALQKKKALTTNLFDIGKKEDSLLQTGIFGNNLNTCVANDRKRSKNFCIALEGESATLSRCGGDDNSNKLNPNVRSCENLPSSTLSVTNTSGENCKGLKSGSKIGTNYFGYLTKSALSRSQSDMRRKSQEFDKNHSLSSSTEFFVTHDLQVPTFITLCIQFLEIHGLHQVGLFRVSTSKKRVMQMKEEFDKRFVTEISETTCPHDVATLLKEFLRDLSEPLLCGHLYKAFLKTQKIRNRRLQLEAISHLIKLLPETHRDTLYVLLKFLAKVATYSDDVLDKEGNVLVSGNKMDSNNLATVFAPNILKSTSLTANVTEQEVMADAINVVRIMIDHFEELFRVSAEILDTVYANILDECPEKLFELCESRLLMSKKLITFLDN
ncbi:rho GTPase-activating protein 6-like [Teleopsis dalmanni]|uniref:rho GTPase-activating protein 6-like n=1 Tax=Teleopsis dalmanni TaxID=139649 RepID=UPI0018CCFDF1|nr:rho GTPase-activating protein 6-like [Teleopsis dalmanni]